MSWDCIGRPCEEIGKESVCVCLCVGGCVCSRARVCIDEEPIPLGSRDPSKFYALDQTINLHGCNNQSLAD